MNEIKPVLKNWPIKKIDRIKRDQKTQQGWRGSLKKKPLTKRKQKGDHEIDEYA